MKGEKLCYPRHSILNILDSKSVSEFMRTKLVKSHPPTCIIHCAAATSPPKCEADKWATMKTNILGTMEMTRMARHYDIPIVYISTEYVFDGKQGNYKEDDPVYPLNYYGWSKLGGEAVVRAWDKHLIIRCAFFPIEGWTYPHEYVPSDQYSSRVGVDTIAKQIYSLIKAGETGTWNLGAPRESVYNRVKERWPDIKEGSCQNFPVPVPVDASLDVSKFAAWREAHEV
jgi:dTDP-4-dehydrorhamnose reductase